VPAGSNLPAGSAGCGFLATGSQEGPVNRLESMAIARVFRLIGRHADVIGLPAPEGGGKREKEE
jgi:hypothetical protein